MNNKEKLHLINVIYDDVKDLEYTYKVNRYLQDLIKVIEKNIQEEKKCSKS